MKNARHAFYTLLMITTISGMSACESKNRDNSADTNTNTNEAYKNDSNTETVDSDANDANAWMRERDDFIATNREIGTRIDKNIETREIEMANMNTKSRKAMQESINSLRIKRKNLDAKLGQMEQATENTWADMKQGINDAATELEKTYDAFDKQYGTKENIKK